MKTEQTINQAAMEDGCQQSTTTFCTTTGELKSKVLSPMMATMLLAVLMEDPSRSRAMSNLHETTVPPWKICLSKDPSPLPSVPHPSRTTDPMSSAAADIAAELAQWTMQYWQWDTPEKATGSWKTRGEQIGVLKDISICIKVTNAECVTMEVNSSYLSPSDRISPCFKNISLSSITPVYW